jgi:hypothetical protein
LSTGYPPDIHRVCAQPCGRRWDATDSSSPEPSTGNPHSSTGGGQRCDCECLSTSISPGVVHICGERRRRLSTAGDKSWGRTVDNNGTVTRAKSVHGRGLAGPRLFPHPGEPETRPKRAPPRVVHIRSRSDFPGAAPIRSIGAHGSGRRARHRRCGCRSDLPPARAVVAESGIRRADAAPSYHWLGELPPAWGAGVGRECGSEGESAPACMGALPGRHCTSCG